MWKRPHLYDPFTCPSSTVPPAVTYNWTHRITRPSRFSGLRLSPVRAALILTTIGGLLLFHNCLSERGTDTSTYDDTSTSIGSPAFSPPEPDSSRSSDAIDTFASYKFRETCNISSLDLHAAFSPLCSDRTSMLAAMSSGGRIGLDAPYMPRGCDMRWFTSEEVCEIIGRFNRVIVVGDSMMRHVVGSINILIRKDIGYGAVTNWNFSEQEKRQCFCNEQFDVKACSVQGIYKTVDVLVHDPDSISCTNPVNVIMEQIVGVPVPQDEANRLKSSIVPSNRPTAFILGHGLWSDLDLKKTVDWLDTILGIITISNWHGLFVTPNAAGKRKPDEWLVSQGNKALMIYEEAVGIEVVKRGIDHLGTWNMSIQSSKYDGVHLDMRGNLVKAMMVINWLNLL